MVTAVAALALIAASTGIATEARADPVVVITLTGSGATSSATSGVSIDGSTVTITAPGDYQLSGTLADGRILVQATEADDVNLIFNGISIANSTGPAISITIARTVTVTLPAGTDNTLSDAESYPAAENANAALFSTEDMTITGTGSLSVRGNYRDGIAGKDTLTIESGTIDVIASDDGIRGKDYLHLTGGSITVTASSHGLTSTNKSDPALGYISIDGGTVDVTAGADCLHAVTDITVAGGSQTLSCGDDAVHGGSTVSVSAGTVDITRSAEGLEALQVLLSGGTVTVTSTDDGINTVEDGLVEGAVSIRALAEVSGGTVVVNAGTDGFDSNGSIEFSGGVTVVNGPVTGTTDEAALDANGAITFSGGTVLAAGILGSTREPAASSVQGFLDATFGAVQPPGTIVHIVSDAGTDLATFRSNKQFRGLVFSSDQIIARQTY
ncbi:MAG: carbohydrate-binding domain-containing protein, partial [Dactylosporangium sp.]|nr:carbohydrate-binding domain-containing protein [Dactylosporangium sp.]NNJ63799.1 carbohydrate-binding domain-containing protein [Dactylosporangium sp.]